MSCEAGTVRLRCKLVWIGSPNEDAIWRWVDVPVEYSERPWMWDYPDEPDMKIVMATKDAMDLWPEGARK